MLTEAGTHGQLQLIRCNPDAPGRCLSDSDALILYYASRNGIEIGRLMALPFHLEPALQPLRLHESHVA